MTTPQGHTTRRIPVPPEPLLAGERPDYADTFELTLEQPDGHSAEQWMRAALEQTAPGIRRLIRFVHARVIRFSSSTEPGSLLGWRTLLSSRDVLHIVTGGPVLRAQIVARRGSETTATISTFLFYERRSAPAIWLLVGPLHRRIAPYLLRRAAAHLTTRTPLPADDRQTGAS